jgi:hypothetical protein
MVEHCATSCDFCETTTTRTESTTATTTTVPLIPVMEAGASTAGFAIPRSINLLQLMVNAAPNNHGEYVFATYTNQERLPLPQHPSELSQQEWSIVRCYLYPPPLAPPCAPPLLPPSTLFAQTRMIDCAVLGLRHKMGVFEDVVAHPPCYSGSSFMSKLHGHLLG